MDVRLKEVPTVRVCADVSEWLYYTYCKACEMNHIVSVSNLNSHLQTNVGGALGDPINILKRIINVPTMIKMWCFYHKIHSCLILLCYSTIMF